MMDSGREEPDYFRDFRRWASEQNGGEVVAMRPLLAEMIGAGVVAADADSAEWKGFGGHPSWDVVGDGVLVDVKHAWPHRDGVLGIPPPPKSGRYDADKVHEIALIVLDGEAVAIQHEYLPGGTVTLTASARARAVYRVPVATMNAVMRQDGRARARWLVSTVDIADFLVRGARP
jgi:hypothetical protein